MPRRNNLEVFLKNIKVQEPYDSGCWVWTRKNLCKDGYGRYHADGRGISAHRYSYSVFRSESGYISPNLCVCHTCDNRQCVNPSHLFLGSPKDNTADMVNKGRQAKGTKARSAKLNDETVKKLRKQAKGTKAKDIARELGVTASTINKVLRGETWKHIDIE